MCTIPSSSKPRERIRPRFCFCRRTGDAVGLMVTFSTGFTMTLQKNVPRRSSLRLSVVMFTPASAPVRRSALRNGLFRVRTFACRKLRYSSFRDGALNDRYIDPVMDALELRARSAESRGLKARLLRDGYSILGDALQ